MYNLDIMFHTILLMYQVNICSLWLKWRWWDSQCDITNVFLYIVCFMSQNIGRCDIKPLQIVTMRHSLCLIPECDKDIGEMQAFKQYVGGPQRVTRHTITCLMHFLYEWTIMWHKHGWMSNCYNPQEMFRLLVWDYIEEKIYMEIQ